MPEINKSDNLECYFCSVAKYEAEGAEIIYENEHFLSVLDNYPAVPGHALVIPRQHLVNLIDVPKDIGIEAFDALQQAQSMIRDRSDDWLEDLKLFYENMVNSPRDEYQARLGRSALDKFAIFSDCTIDSFTVGINDGKLAGRTIDHLHFQVMPRFDGDGSKDSTFGVRRVFPDTASYKNVD